MYEVYLDDMRLPITPQKITMKTSGQNETITLINGEEVNILRPPGLMEISFDAVIPQVSYPFAVWDGSFDDAGEFVERLRELKENQESFEFIVIRKGPGDREFFDTNLDVSLEDFKVVDDVKEGMDVTVSINLKEYRSYGTKVMNFTIVPAAEVPVAVEAKPERSAPTPPSTYTVVSGDCLWKIAKKILGDGNRWREIYNLNTTQISNPNLIQPGWVLVLP